MTEQVLDWRDPIVEHYLLRWRMLHSGRVVYDKTSLELIEQTLAEIDDAQQRHHIFDKDRLRQSFSAALERTEVEWQR